MTLAAAEIFVPTLADADNRPIADSHNTQALLRLESGKANYQAQAIAVILYMVALAGVVTFSNPHKEVVTEEPLELVVVPSPANDSPPPDALEEAPPPEAVDEPLPPPEAIDPIAPITPREPIQKPAPKPIPKVEKHVERKPAPRQDAARRTGAAPAAGANASNSNATQSLAANQFLSCMQRAAARAAPDSPIPKHGRVAYRASFSPSGSMTSFSITPSGNALLDGIASRLGSHCGSLPAIGHPFNVSGGVVF